MYMYIGRVHVHACVRVIAIECHVIAVHVLDVYMYMHVYMYM